LIFSKSTGEEKAIQYKEAVWDHVGRALESQADKIVERAKFWAEKMNAKGLHISFNLKKLIPRIKKDESIDKLAYYIIETALAKQPNPYSRDSSLIYSWDEDDEVYLSEIKEYLSYYFVNFIKEDDVIFGWGYGSDMPHALPHYSDVIIALVKKHQFAQLQDCILLLHATGSAIDEKDLREIKEGLRGINSPETWIVQTFLQHKHIYRVI